MSQLSLSRRRFAMLAAGAALGGGLGGARAASADEHASHAAMYGAAPFETSHLIPGDTLDLSLVDRNAPTAQVAALTIDDGPDAHELQMAEYLAAEGAQATFFAIGQKLRAHPEGAKRLAAAGHEIGCHSYAHPMMTTLTAQARDNEFKQSLAAFQTAGLPAPTWFRPPYGDWNGDVIRRARAFGMRTVVWTVDSRDWKTQQPEMVVARVVENLTAGAVILLHGTKTATTAALPEILAEGRRRGLSFVTMTKWRELMTQSLGPARTASRPAPGATRGAL